MYHFKILGGVWLSNFLTNIFLSLTFLIVSLASFNPAYADEDNEDDKPATCVYDKGVFTTSSGIEFKGPGSKAKCYELERKELVEKKCTSGSGAVSNDAQGNFTVECD